MNTIENTKKMIHTLANVNLDVIDEKVNLSSPSLQGRSVTIKHFDNSLTKLIEIIQSQPQILEDKTIVSDLSKIYQNLSSSTIKEGTSYTKISKLMNAIPFYLWDHSKITMQKTIQDLPYNDEQKLLLAKNFIDKQGYLFLHENTLGITEEFIQKTKNSQLGPFLQKLLKQHPQISFIQVQGAPPISRAELTKYLTDHKPLIKLILLPIVCTWDDPPYATFLHPLLTISSQFLISRRHFLELSKSPGQELKNLEITPEIVELLNRHATNLDSIEINKDNISDLLNAAHYFLIPELIKKCDLYLCKTYSQELKNLKEIDFVGYVTQLSQDINYDLPNFKTFLEKTLSHWILETNRIDIVLRRIKLLNQNAIPVHYLDFESYHSISDNNLISILNVCPSLTSLNLSHCTDLTAAIEPALTKLKHLKNLDLSFSYISIEHLAPHLPKLKNLQDLRLFGCWITGSVGLSLGKCQKLQRLEISYADDSLGPFIAQLTHLQILYLSGQCTNALGSHLEKLTELQNLYLLGCPIDSNFGSSLVKLKKLHSLEITFSQVDDQLGSYLMQMKQLKILNISVSKVTASIGSSIAEISHLQKLSIANADVTDEIGSFIKHLSELEVLDLSSTLITNAIAKDFAQFKKLKTFKAHYTRVDASKMQKDIDPSIQIFI